MARNWVNMFMLVLCPLLVSAVLISAFSSLLATYEKTDSFMAGYSIEEGSAWAKAEETMIAAGSEAGINLIRFSGGDPETNIRESDLGGFVAISDSGYKIYRTEDQKAQGMTLEYFFTVFFDQAAAAASGVNISTDAISLSVEHPEFVKAVDSCDYYGIAYPIYFSWCGIICAYALLSGEKKYGIGKRFVVSNLTDTQITLSKFIPSSVFVFLGIAIACVLSAFLFGVHWGNVFLIGSILAVMIPAAIALGLAFYSISDNIIITIISLFGLVWTMGFFGGTFETYMFSSHPKILKLLSPIYHCNRAIIEISSSGKSDYYLSALLYCGAIVIVCLFVSIMAGKIRRRGRA